jgi:TP901 family phage tail tape measure protein
MPVPDIEKLVRIVFAGDDSALGQTISNVGSGMDRLAGNINKATQPLADFTDTVLKVDAVLAGVAAGALVVATTQAGRFGDSFNEIATLIEAPTSALEGFKLDVLDYSRDSGAALNEITSATYNIISATGDWEGALQRLTVAEQLNTAGKGTLNDTAKILSTSMNAYGASTNDAADYADVLFTTVKVGVTTLEELSSGLGSVTGLAANAGVPFDDLSASVGALTGTVGDTSLAVTQIKSLLTAIIAPSDGAAKAAERLGIEFNKQTLEAMGLEKFLKMVFEATGGNADIMKELIPRVEGVNAALVLGQDASGKYAAAMEQMENRAGAVANAYSTMADNFAETNQRIINNLQATLIQVGTPLLDEWGALADAIVNIFKGVSVGFDTGAFDPLINFIEKTATEITAYFEGVADALPEALAGINWDDFIKALDDLVETGKTVLNGLFGGLDLTRPADLEKAIQKVIDTFENWIRLTEGIIEGLAPFIQKLVELASGFSEVDGETVRGAGTIAGWGKAINLVSGFIPNLTAPLKLLSASIGLLSVTQIPALVKAFGTIGPALSVPLAALAPLAALFGTFAALTPDTGIGTWLRENSTLFNSFANFVDKTVLSLGGFDTKQIETMEIQASQTQALGKLMVEYANLTAEIEKVPEQKEISIDSKVDDALIDFFTDIDQLTWNLQNIDGYELEIKADTSQAQTELEKISDWNTIFVEGGEPILIPVSVDSEGAEAAAQAAKDKIDEKLPSEKIMEIELQGEIDIQLEKIKTAAETVQTAMEWKAKIDIAEIEAETEKLVQLSGDISSMFQSAGDVMSDAFGILASLDPHAPGWNLVSRILEEESKRRQLLLEKEIELTDAQIRMMDARIKAIDEGGGLITIKADGVYPTLELVLHEIIELAQIRANEEGLVGLFGV